MSVADWHSWHDAYDDPESWQARRLATVRQRVQAALDEAPPGPVSVLAMVAGQGGFEEVWVTEPGIEHAVAVHRATREPRPLEPGVKLFTFVGIRALRPWDYPATGSGPAAGSGPAS